MPDTSLSVWLGYQPPAVRVETYTYRCEFYCSFIVSNKVSGETDEKSGGADPRLVYFAKIYK